MDKKKKKKYLTENKLTSFSILSESSNKLPIPELKKSTEEIKKWIHNILPSDLKSDERGNQIFDIKNDIDYAIIIQDNKYIFKLDNKDFTSFRLIRRDNGNEEIHAYSDNKKVDSGTITNSRYYFFNPSQIYIEFK